MFLLEVEIDLCGELILERVGGGGKFMYQTFILQGGAVETAFTVR